MEINTLFYYTILVLSSVNLLRVLVYLVSSDIYELRSFRSKQKSSKAGKPFRPWITVIIPAYNEEICITRTVESVLGNGYGRKQVIVVDDGSTDRTYQALRSLKKVHKKANLKIVKQKNRGKAAAINNALFKHAKGSLVMVLDADSLLHPEALENMVQHFSNPNVLAAASNVKIIDSRSVLGLAQRFEYLISYRTKRALSLLNIEYIIGGVGSTFRKKVVKDVGGYDTDTMTEDIDFTLKIIKEYGNKKQAISYAADVITYTESVMSFRSLVKQRFRWKYGRFQSFIKNRTLFFNQDKRYDKKLTCLQLPYALWAELVLLIEPLLVGFIGYIVVAYGDLHSLLTVYLVVTGYIFLNVMGEPSETFRSKLRLSLWAPVMYIVLYILLIVEFAALLQSIYKAQQLRSGEKDTTWQHVERAGAVVKL